MVWPTLGQLIVVCCMYVYGSDGRFRTVQWGRGRQQGRKHHPRPWGSVKVRLDLNASSGGDNRDSQCLAVWDRLMVSGP